VEIRKLWLYLHNDVFLSFEMHQDVTLALVDYHRSSHGRKQWRISLNTSCCSLKDIQFKTYEVEKWLNKSRCLLSIGTFPRTSITTTKITWSELVGTMDEHQTRRFEYHPWKKTIYAKLHEMFVCSISGCWSFSDIHHSKLGNQTS